jgi:DNA-binding response OmpR family regulator
MAEQFELPIVGLSKENREKVNTRIWIVGDENSPLVNLIKAEGYQVRVFHDGSLLEEELSEKELDCDLIITNLPYEIDFFVQDIHEMLGLENFPVVVLGEEIDSQQDQEYFRSIGAIYVSYLTSKNALLSKIRELTTKSKEISRTED